MKRFELQKLVVSDPNSKYEHWRRIIQSNHIEALKVCLAENHRIVEVASGNEIMRYNNDKYKKPTN